MFSNYLGSIEGIEVYPIIGLTLFLLVFIGVVVRIYKMDKTHILKMSNLPLEEHANLSTNNEIENEIK